MYRQTNCSPREEKIVRKFVAESLEDFFKINDKNPGALRIMHVYLNNGDCLAGYITTNSPLSSGEFAFKSDGAEPRQLRFGKESEEVHQIQWSTWSLHIDKHFEQDHLPF
ncbi:MAG: hypothetical protein WA058_03675 [Minisyncoccia bacterium]